ncbi:MAG: acyl carrier protein [Oscillospiraceae bacterium]|nr:acyl carrier protein [Oscillospiraceae bacterium]MBQ7130650.1 acyl carrier protein [Oscillospiraceae bacterium]
MLEKLIEIIRDVCEIEEEITPESRFVEDFGLSSLDMFRLITEVEESFDVSINTRRLQKILVVADLMEELEK